MLGTKMVISLISLGQLRMCHYTVCILSTNQLNYHLNQLKSEMCSIFSSWTKIDELSSITQVVFVLERITLWQQRFVTGVWCINCKILTQTMRKIKTIKYSYHFLFFRQLHANIYQIIIFVWNILPRLGLYGKSITHSFWR